MLLRGIFAKSAISLTVLTALIAPLAHAAYNEIKITPADGEPHGIFGTSVSIHGNTAIAGSWSDDHGVNSGSAYLFDTTTGNEIAKLTASDPGANHHFGSSVGI